ncbi:hypothetical protein [Streptomyces altiplanensis]
MAMTRREDSGTQPPHFELRCGGLHLTVQRIPGWLVALITTAGGVAGTWWSQQ